MVIVSMMSSLEVKIMQCRVCFEAWTLSLSTKSLELPDYMCSQCKRDKKKPQKFSKENMMIPSNLLNPLRTLTQVEELLIARAFPVMQIYSKPRGGQLTYKGHVITIPNNDQIIAKR